ncbi:MAG: DUF4301 family protein [Bacteroidales bacterium]|nr:DUF4301 family protein [Bacteroidales bacterium]
MEFTDSDALQIIDHGLLLDEVKRQLDYFSVGFPYVCIDRAATVGDGIRSFDDSQVREYIALYENNIDKYSVMKFVPASGAATRMMKDLYEFVSLYQNEQTTPLNSFLSVKQTMENIDKFAFYNHLNMKMQADNVSLQQCIRNRDYKTVAEYILFDKGLGYGKYPKAWIEFHKLQDKVVTALEQHLTEGYQYALNADGRVRIEFTVLKAHASGFRKMIKELVPVYEQKYGVKYDITLSYQQSNTDTVAVDMSGRLFHDKNGDLVFRPSGHGALISNLDKVKADIIFIKNIDNISSCYLDQTVMYKKLLAGVLIATKQKIEQLWTKLKQRSLDKQDVVSIARTMGKQLQISGIQDHTKFPTLTMYRRYLRELLERPVRVCGMVQNTGEPGGGPFYVKKDAKTTLQIVEKAQVNMNNGLQRDLFMNATHFNPVDLVVSTVSPDGKKFKLDRYIDYQTGFISEKSYEGQRIKAMEKPGLWNGAMSDWITVFVQVPIETFNPVKTLNDLLKPPHQ